MNFYETMYIIHPALQAGRLEDIIKNIDNKIKSLKGKKLYYEHWGKKKLAYPIDKQKYGTYVIVQFSLNSPQIADLTDEFEHNANILRYLINKIDDSEILEQKKEDSPQDEQEKDNSSQTKDSTTKEEKISKTKEKIEE